jgi:predicted nucleic acid-binding protein
MFSWAQEPNLLRFWNMLKVSHGPHRVDSLYVSAVTVGEIQAGIEITRKQDAEKAKEIEEWLDGVEGSYGVLSADAAVIRRWAQLMHRRPVHHIEDALIAATALVRGLTVVTRNVDDFKPFGTLLINPFD